MFQEPLSAHDLDIVLEGKLALSVSRGHVQNRLVQHAHEHST